MAMFEVGFTGVVKSGGGSKNGSGAVTTGIGNIGFVESFS